MNVQLALDLAPMARRLDPPTSHAAAESAVEIRGRHHAMILAALKHGAAGKDRIGARTGLSGVSVARRLTELARAGLIVDTQRTEPSNSGRQERIWEVCA